MTSEVLLPSLITRMNTVYKTLLEVPLLATRLVCMRTVVTDKEMVVANGIKSVEGIALDWVTKNLYYTDGINGVIGVVRVSSRAFRDRRNLLTGRPTLYFAFIY